MSTPITTSVAAVTCPGTSFTDRAAAVTAVITACSAGVTAVSQSISAGSTTVSQSLSYVTEAVAESLADTLLINTAGTGKETTLAAGLTLIRLA